MENVINGATIDDLLSLGISYYFLVEGGKQAENKKLGLSMAGSDNFSRISSARHDICLCRWGWYSG